jgi:hypothetical protein
LGELIGMKRNIIIEVKILRRRLVLQKVMTWRGEEGFVV